MIGLAGRGAVRTFHQPRVERNAARGGVNEKLHRIVARLVENVHADLNHYRSSISYLAEGLDVRLVIDIAIARQQMDVRPVDVASGKVGIV